MRPLVTPQINLNGTSRDALLNQQCKVLSAFDKLREAMSEAAPHGRDYQLKLAEYDDARAAWLERIEMLDAMRRQIEEHVNAIFNAGK